MSKIRKILQLQDAELSQRQISGALKISRPVISEILTKCNSANITWMKAVSMIDSELEEIVYGARRTTSKAEQLQTLFPDMVIELSKVGVTKQRLWSEYLEDHPDGLNYSQFCNLLRQWVKTSELSMHIEYKAGDKLLGDFAGNKLQIYDRKTGKATDVEVFVSVLGFSGRLFVKAVESQKTQVLIRALEDTMHFHGGVTKAIVTDNLKAAVIKADKYEPELNQQTEDFCRYYRTALLPTRAYKPKDKALVESAVSLTYQRVYAALRKQKFHTLEELNQAILPLVEAHNNRKLTKMPVSRQELFEEHEKSKLKSLPIERYPLKEISTGKAGFNYHVYLKTDKHYYSIPYLYAGKEVTLMFDERNVAIYFQNERIALHKRHRTSGMYSTIAEHMPPNHRFYHEWSPERFKNWAKSIGKETHLVISHILQSKKHPEQAFKSCLGILNFEKKYSAEILNLTCRTVWNREQISYTHIKLTIDSVKEQLEKNNKSTWKDLPQEHENVRGNTYT